MVKLVGSPLDFMDHKMGASVSTDTLSLSVDRTVVRTFLKRNCCLNRAFEIRPVCEIVWLWKER